MTETVMIKGTGEGLVITLGEGPWSEVLTELETRLASRASFFLGGRVALRVHNRALSAEQLREIGTIIEQRGMTIWAVESTHPTSQMAARELGLETQIRAVLSEIETASEFPVAEMTGIVVRRTLRSGQTIHYPGHVTLIGDVNPGAEVVAGGDVIVWGKLRGTVHAGAMGDDRAVVCALELAPSQIRIGSHVARSPERGRRPKTPEIARVQEEGIVVEPWSKWARPES
ncbi:MAG: septum site-determining protein MinC [Anaerolineae bacterium]